MDNRTIEKTATNVPETEPTKTDIVAAIPQANLAPGVGGAMLLKSKVKEKLKIRTRQR